MTTIPEVYQDNSKSAFELLEIVAKESSKNAKIELLRDFFRLSTFKNAVVAALHPQYVYGVKEKSLPESGSIKSIMGRGTDSGTNFGPNTWNLLGLLREGKLTGHRAIEALDQEFRLLNRESALLLRRIVLKDLRAGFSESTVNKVIKGLIPEFPYMRCTLLKNAKVENFDWAAGVFSQEKADGMFVNVDVLPSGDVRISSRQGSQFPLDELDYLVADIKLCIPKDTQSHGEMIVIDTLTGEVLPREIGNGMLNSVAEGGALENGYKARILLWDQIPLSYSVPKGEYRNPYSERFANLKRQLIVSSEKPASDYVQIIETKVVHSLDEAFQHYREKLNQGKEGTIFKDPGAIWKDGTSKDQVKLKLEVDVDLEIIAIVPGKEGTKNEYRAGSVTCATSCRSLVTDVTVKNEDMRDRIDANESDFIGRIITVRANAIMKPSESNDQYSLFLPRFVEANVRKDKTKADDLQRVKDQFESAAKAK